MAPMTRHSGPEGTSDSHGGSSRGKGRPSGPASREVLVSKKLSWVLRHGAKQERLNMDGGGWVNAAELLRWHGLRSMKVSFSELAAVVADNNKQRFELCQITPEQGEATVESYDSENFRIRASQGHSLEIDSTSLLTPVNLTDEDFPSEVVHGTNAAAWKLILSTGGLRRMTRTHIHFAVDLPGEPVGKIMPAKDEKMKSDPELREMVEANEDTPEAQEATKDFEIDDQKARRGEGFSMPIAGKVISGMRASATILVWIDVRKSILEGKLHWWRSANGVLLTEGNEDGMIKMAFVSQVVVRSNGHILWKPESTKLDEV